MEDASFWELLFSKDSIAGVWAVIGAFIALLGIFANNLWENTRKKKEREHALIRDAYFGAVEYINYHTNNILRIGQSGQIETDSEGVAASEKYYKLFLIASPEVIDAFTKLSQKYTEIIMRLTESVLNLQNCTERIKTHQQAIDNALNIMNLVNADMKEYNEKNKSLPELWKSFEQRNAQAQQDFDEYGEQIDVDHKQVFELKMTLIHECIELLLTTYSDTYDVIFMMRSDLDRKLSKKDSKKIKDSFNSLQTHLENSLSSHIDKLKARILEMAQED